MATFTAFPGTVIRTTEAAVLVRPRAQKGVEHIHGEQWFPRRVLLDGDTLDVGDSDIEVRTWFIRKQGIEVP